uniref:Phage protein n=1 Tax=Vibrio cyclitrophicus TaxID=47951 RepID=A0A0H3ZU05_9VIBR|nr:Phage protein [Vibrio cyclitrophicus]
MKKHSFGSFAQPASGSFKSLSKAKRSDPIGERSSPHSKALKRLSDNPEKAKGNREHFVQVALFDRMFRDYPEIYKRMAAIPNGVYCHKRTAQSMVEEGLKKGYPDITLDAPRGAYHGMKLELKVGNNKLSSHQRAWLDQLNADGYYAVCVYGLEAAVNAFVRYWFLAPKERMAND